MLMLSDADAGNDADMYKGRNGWGGMSRSVTSLGRTLDARKVTSSRGASTDESGHSPPQYEKKNYDEDMRDSLRNLRVFWFSMRRIRYLSNSRELRSISKDPLSSPCASLLPGSIHGDEE